MFHTTFSKAKELTYSAISKRTNGRSVAIDTWGDRKGKGENEFYLGGIK